MFLICPHLHQETCLCVRLALCPPPFLQILNQSVGVVLSFDILQSASPPEYVRSLSNLKAFLSSGSGKTQPPASQAGGQAAIVPMDLDAGKTLFGRKLSQAMRGAGIKRA